MTGLRSRQALAVLAAALLLLVLQRTTPGYGEITGPIPLHGASGETVAARTFLVTVDKAILAESLRWSAFGREQIRDTGGLWIAVHARLEARYETTTVASAIWRGPSGRHFEASRRVSGAPSALLGERLEPGLPRQGLFLFEVPADEARGGTLLISATRAPRLDSQARIVLARDAVESIDRLDIERPNR